MLRSSPSSALLSLNAGIPVPFVDGEEILRVDGICDAPRDAPRNIDSVDEHDTLCVDDRVDDADDDDEHITHIRRSHLRASSVDADGCIHGCTPPPPPTSQSLPLQHENEHTQPFYANSKPNSQQWGFFEEGHYPSDSSDTDDDYEVVDDASISDRHRAVSMTSDGSAPRSSVAPPPASLSSTPVISNSGASFSPSPSASPPPPDANANIGVAAGKKRKQHLTPTPFGVGTPDYVLEESKR